MSTAASKTGYDTNEYRALFERGIVSCDERLELLEGMVVSMAPPSPLHSAIVHHVQTVLASKLPAGTLIRSQMPFVAGPKSLPEPDVAVVPGRNSDYFRRDPSTVHLLVEVADSSLAQDRLTKAAIYARAGVPIFWIVNLRDPSVECFSDPDQIGGRYLSAVRATGSARLPLAAFPSVEIEARDLLPAEAFR